MKTIEHEKMKEILATFEAISRIPRCSKHEEHICKWLLQWAMENDLKAETDGVGNVLIHVPATATYAKAPAVVIQGHVDMVCEKTPDSRHDFSKDPIEFVFEEDWLKANHTTLGADNGIALAIALELAKDKKIPHAELELLFTVDEETGLTGANALQPGFLQGKVLLNVDSEDEGVFTVGCAGGKDTHMALDLDYEEVAPGQVPFQLKVSGLLGGHSGVNIHEQRANAIRLLARTLDWIRRDCDLRIVFVSGGTAHNAIPRDSLATVFLPADQAAVAGEHVREAEKVFRAEFKDVEKDLNLTWSEFGQVQDNRAMTVACSRRVVDILLALPHGVAAMSQDIPGLVETSNNLASAKVVDGRLKVVTSQRSSVMSRLEAMTGQIEAVAALSGAEVRSSDGYPSWQPNLQSPLLAKCKRVYRKLYGKEAKVEAIHAGLECGIIGDKNPGMDMISFGPTLKNPHSPDEKIYVPSIGKVWDFLIALLKALK